MLSHKKASIDLDIRLMTNYYKSSGFYDIKINSKLAKINEMSARVIFLDNA